jgi:ATP-dependent Clp endopeptidase proteolytic subunit ClpP
MKYPIKNYKKYSKNEFQIKNENEDTADLMIYGIIGDYWDEVDAKDIVQSIKNIKAKEIIVSIYSDGGSVFAGLAIYNALREHPAKVTVKIDSLAASIASVIAMAGEVEMPENAFLMIHNPWGGVVGESKDMRKMADILDKLKGSLIMPYNSKTKIADEEISKMMDEETWLTAAEAVEKGFADRIIGETKAQFNNFAIFNQLTNFKKVPESIKNIIAHTHYEDGLDFLDEVKRIMDENKKSLENKIESITITGGNTLDEKDKNKDLTPEQLRKIEDEKIDTFAKSRFDGKFKAFADKAKATGLNYDQFASLVFDKIQEEGSTFETPASFLDLSPQQLKTFRLTRAAQMVIEGKTKLPESENISFEFECSKAIEKKLGKAPQNGTIYLPYDIRQRELKHSVKSNKFMNAHSTTPGEGGEFVPTEHRTDLMPEFLRNATVMGRLGATILTGLQGNLEIPKIVSSLSVSAVAENNAASASYITTGKLTAQPHTVSGNTQYGRQWFYQSDLSVDTMLMNELEATKNVKVDYLSLNGDGVTTEPLGFLKTPGITDVEMTAPTWRKILSFAKTIKKANAFSGSRFAWLMSADVEQEVKAAEKFATTGQTFLMNNQMDGFPYEWSNQVGDQVLTLANWAEAYMLFWGAEELLIDPYSLSTAGLVRLTIFSMFDFLFRQTQAGVIADDYALVG